MLQSSPTRSSLFLPSNWCVLICVVPRFKAHQPAPPSSSPPASESSLVTCHASKLTNPFLPLPPLQLVSPCFVSCHISKLTNLLLPLPPLQQVSPRLRYATLRSSLTCSSLFLPSNW